MDGKQLAEIIGAGVVELGLEWPKPEHIYELRIKRAVFYDHEKEALEVKTFDQYLDFLILNIFPLLDQLENEAFVSYWHILNHDHHLDLRISIEDDAQMQQVTKVLKEHPVAQQPVTNWGIYQDNNLGSRLGCQALLRLYHAQSKFVRDMVRSIYWLKNHQNHSEIAMIIRNIIETVPIYTSHMLLNVFPGISYYEGIKHITEGELRLRSLMDSGGLPIEAKGALDEIRNASGKLNSLISNLSG